MQQLLEVGLRFGHVFAIDRLTPQNLGALQLRLDDASLTAFAEAVMRERILDERPQCGIRVIEDGECLLEIGKPQIEQLDLFRHIGADSPYLSFGCVCLA